MKIFQICLKLGKSCLVGLAPGFITSRCSPARPTGQWYFFKKRLSMLSHLKCYHIWNVIIYELFSHMKCYHIWIVLTYEILSYMNCSDIWNVIIYELLSHMNCSHIWMDVLRGCSPSAGTRRTTGCWSSTCPPRSSWSPSRQVPSPGVHRMFISFGRKA
jgi:hypothetical protein